MKNLRTLHAIDTLKPEAGAASICVTGLLRTLTSRDFQADILVADGSGGAIESSQVQQFGPDGAKQAIGDCDVLHIHGWERSPFVRSVMSAAYRSGKPYVLSSLGSLCGDSSDGGGIARRFGFHLKDKPLIRKAAALTALNDHEAKLLKARRLHREVAILPYGLSFEEYEGEPRMDLTLPEVDGDRCLLVLGPIHPKYGLVALLRTFAELGTKGKNWYIVLAGPEIGDWRKSLEAAVRRKDGSRRVVFVPASDTDSQRALLHHADLLVCPSIGAHCPVSILQALALGVPVLACRCVAPPDSEGLIENCSAIRDDLYRMLATAVQRSPDELSAIGLKARDAARQRFDWESLVDRFLKLYERVRSGES